MLILIMGPTNVNGYAKTYLNTSHVNLNLNPTKISILKIKKSFYTRNNSTLTKIYQVTVIFIFIKNK